MPTFHVNMKTVLLYFHLQFYLNNTYEENDHAIMELHFQVFVIWLTSTICFHIGVQHTPNEFYFACKNTAEQRLMLSVFIGLLTGSHSVSQSRWSLICCSCPSCSSWPSDPEWVPASDTRPSWSRTCGKFSLRRKCVKNYILVFRLLFVCVFVRMTQLLPPSVCGVSLKVWGCFTSILHSFFISIQQHDVTGNLSFNGKSSLYSLIQLLRKTNPPVQRWRDLRTPVINNTT